jgi:hypothetical protein
MCTFRRSLVQCQACPLGKSSHLSLRPIGHKASTPLDLIFNDIWGYAPMFSSDGFRYFVIYRCTYKIYMVLSSCCQISCVSYISTFLINC